MAEHARALFWFVLGLYFAVCAYARPDPYLFFAGACFLAAGLSIDRSPREQTMSESQTLNLSLTLPAGFSADDAASAIRAAANRAAWRIESNAVPTPLPVDEDIDLGSDAKGATAIMFRSE